ncbi:MAG TPA: hypothetical protein VG692_18405 [Gemmatimonadales bacterium]|nr:hypothetical protein [Gemmatimonadales bacterium]
MSELRARWQAILTDLERQRDELKVRLHLARAEARDEWEKLRLDEKLATLRQRADAAGVEARGAMHDIGTAAEKLADEVREGLDRVRKTL